MERIDDTILDRILRHYSIIQILIILDAFTLGVIYTTKELLLGNPAYIAQGDILPHWFFGIVFLCLSFWALAKPAYTSKIRHYRYLLAAATAVYFGLAMTFIPFGYTAVATYAAMSIIFLIEAYIS